MAWSRQETTPRLHAISCTKTGWSSLSHNRVLHQALARSLRESKVQFVVEDAWPFRERANGQNYRLNPLRMDITTETGALFDNHPPLKNKALPLDITIVNPWAGSNLGNVAHHVGKHLADAVERKKNKCVCVFSSHLFWMSGLDVPTGVTQEEGHAGFLIHLPSAALALIFLARRIQPFLSLVDREVEFFVLTI